MEIVLGMYFLVFSNADFQFDTEKFNWRSYTAAEALPTTSQVELTSDKKEFDKVALLDENSETFVLHATAWEIPIAIAIHLL